MQKTMGKIILLDIEPFSINKAYYKRSFTRTTECRAWADRVVIELEKPHNRLVVNKIREGFSPKEHEIILKIDYLIPFDKFFTKKDGSISCNSKDLSNIEKMLIDVLMDERHFERDINNLNINDARIVKLESVKAPANRFVTIINIEINSLSPIKRLYKAVKSVVWSKKW